MSNRYSPFKFPERLLRPLPLGLMMAALLIRGVAIGVVLQSSLFSGATASSTGEAEVRIAATPRDDGSVRLGLQQQDADSAYGDVETLSVVNGFAPLGDRLAAGDVGAVVLLSTADAHLVLPIIKESGASPPRMRVGDRGCAPSWYQSFAPNAGVR